MRPALSCPIGTVLFLDGAVLRKVREHRAEAEIPLTQ
jgi:hypothetical protein